MTAHLSSPLPLPCGVELPNRLAKAAMSERLADDRGRPTPRLDAVYRRWSSGGAGLLITGNVMVDGRHLGEPGNVVVEGDTHLDTLRSWSAAATAGGNQAWMQINHPGRQSPRHVNAAPVAPSEVGMELVPGTFARPRALSEHEIHDIIARFARTAAIAKHAGFTGVQIHGAHGYLVSQFLSPRTNRRTDGWGGDEARRMRFLLEIVRAIRAAVGDRLPVGVKLNSADFQRGGFTEDASMRVVEALDAESVDLLEISGGTYESAAAFEETVPSAESSQRREAFFLDYANRVRERTRLPLMVTGGFRTKEGMDAALVSGALDVVGLARPLAAEPDLPARLLGGQASQARPIRLNTGWKTLDNVIQGGWYSAQIRRMGAGLEPDPGLCRARAVVSYFAPGA